MEKCNVIPATSDFNKKEYDIIGIKKLKRVIYLNAFCHWTKREPVLESRKLVGLELVTMTIV